ncbi:MAG: hypothetical protein AB1442_01215, partial [Nitrospirota bacterium]
VSLSPSVHDSEKNKTWVNDTGKLKNEFAFSFVVERRASPGDCQTFYWVCGYDYSLNTYQNGVLIGTGKTVNFDAEPGHNATNSFESILSIRTEYQIDHYELVTHCTSGPEGEFCWTSCDFSHTDSIRSELNLSDRKTAYTYVFTPLANSIVESFERGLADLWVFAASNEDFNRYDFRIGNLFFETDGMQYSLGYGLPPYNVLTPEASRSPTKNRFYGLSVMENDAVTMTGGDFGNYLQATEPFLYSVFRFFGVNFSALPPFYGVKAHVLVPTNSLNCSLNLHSHFRTQEYSDFCILTNQTPVLNLSIANRTSDWFTVKVEFYDNLTGTPLANKEIIVRYGNQTETVTTDSTGAAFLTLDYSPTSSTLSAEFRTDFQTKSANVRLIVPSPPLEIWDKVVTAVIVVLFAWFVYRLIRRFFP